MIGISLFYSNGLRDPWSSGGVVKPIGSLVSVLIPEGAHHLDLRASNPLDPKSVIDGRNMHKDNIRKWINQVGVRAKPDIVNTIPVPVVNQQEERVLLEILP